MSLADLARLAVKQCTPVFKKANREIGVGLYPDRVYIDIRLSFRFWNPSLQYSSVVRSPEELTTYMKRLFSAAFGMYGDLLGVESPGVGGHSRAMMTCVSVFVKSHY